MTDTTSRSLFPTGGPGPVQRFIFGIVPDSVTCTPVTFNWTYEGPTQTFSFLVSSSIAPHTDFPGQVRRAITELPIASNLQTTDGTWTWPSVIIEQGWYELQAVGTGLTWTATSPQFYVTNGTDTSCLIGTVSSTTSASSTAMPTSTFSTSTASSPSTTSSAIAIPVAAASSSSRTGAIAGGVVGGLVIIGAVIAGYLYFGLCRRTPTRSRRRAMDGPQAGELGRWGGLSSRDSGMDAFMAGPGKPMLAMGMALPSKKHGKTESTGAMLSPLSSTGHSAAARGVSDEDLATLAEEEKFVPYSKAHEYIETVPPLAYNRRRSSASTSGGGGLSPISSIPEPPPSAGSIGRSRARSSSQSHRAMAFAMLDGSDAVPASSRTRSPTVPRRSLDGHPMVMPVNHPYDVPVPQMNRTSSGGGPGARRAARKPVPQLDASEVSMPPTPTTGASISRGQSLSSTVTAASTATPSPTVPPMYRNDSHSSANLRTLAPGRQHSREDLEAAGMELPDLNHKSSFGDRQVHYLIPDMPPPPPRN